MLSKCKLTLYYCYGWFSSWLAFRLLYSMGHGAWHRAAVLWVFVHWSQRCHGHQSFPVRSLEHTFVSRPISKTCISWMSFQLLTKFFIHTYGLICFLEDACEGLMKVFSLEDFLEFSAFELNFVRTKSEWRGKRRQIILSKKRGIWTRDASDRRMFWNIEMDAPDLRNRLC